EQYKDAPPARIDPDTRPCKPVVTEAVRRQIGSARRILRRRKLPTDRARLFQSRRHVLPKQPARLRREQRRRLTQKLLRHQKRFARSREQSRMPRRTA